MYESSLQDTIENALRMAHDKILDQRFTETSRDVTEAVWNWFKRVGNLPPAWFAAGDEELQNEIHRLAFNAVRNAWHGDTKYYDSTTEESFVEETRRHPEIVAKALINLKRDR